MPEDRVTTDRRFPAAVPPWMPPSSTAHVGYDPTPDWAEDRSACTGSFTQGAAVLRDFLQVQFPAIKRIGGYSCRRSTGDRRKASMHSQGRALDVHVDSIELGTAIADWLVAHAEEIGVQLVIWNRTAWQPSERVKASPYRGGSRHLDHVHVEITLQAAEMRTPWYGERSGPAAPAPEQPT